MQRLSAFLCGGVFAAGLAVSGMIKPAKVIGFLDVTGAWDPTLGFVMGGALLVFLPGHRLVMRRGKPLLGEVFDLPKHTDITPQLVAGAAIFGLGWGITGFCPAAAIAALAGLSADPLAVTVGMAVGILGMKASRAAVSSKPSAPVAVADF